MLGLKVIYVTKSVPWFEAYVSRNHLQILKDLSEYLLHDEIFMSSMSKQFNGTFSLSQTNTRRLSKIEEMVGIPTYYRQQIWHYSPYVNMKLRRQSYK